MQLSDLQLLYEYNYWASAKILLAATNVTAADFVAPASFPNGSLRGVLVHIAAAEWVWRLRLDEQTYPTALLDEADFPTFADVLERFQAEEGKMRAFLARLTDEQLNATVSYKDTGGKESSQIMWQILTHVVMHGMQHRAEAAAILTDLGHSPGNIDLIIYLRERR
ncbi:MAG: DinB family protein [Caldilineaceae bacterium]